MENIRVEEIMKNYKKTEKNLTKTEKNSEYLDKVNDIKDKKIEINKLKLHIERYQEEESATHDFRVKEEYQKQIKEAEKELENQEEVLKKLEEEKEVILVEKKKNEKELRKEIHKNANELQDKARKELMAEKKELDTQMAKKKMELEIKRFELSQFAYRYDENGVPTNGEDFKKLQEESLKLKKEIGDLEALSKKCEEYQQELVQPFEMPAELPDDKIYVGYEKKKEKSQEKPQLSEIEEKIQKAKEEMKQANKDYKNIHFESDQTVPKVNITTKSKEEGPKNIFETNNIIDNAYKNIENENRNYAQNVMTGEELKDTPTVSNVETKAKIDYIEILEGQRSINYRDAKGNENTLESMIDRKSKKEMFKRLGIADMCEEVSDGVVISLWLKRKINPNIVLVLQEHPEQLKEYITAIHKKTKLPFELVHNLKEVGIWEKLKLTKFTRAEEKSGAKIIGKLFNKNQTLKEGTKTESANTRNTTKKDFVEKVDNRDSHIEKEANKVLENAEKNRGKEVEEILKEENEK